MVLIGGLLGEHEVAFERVLGSHLYVRVTLVGVVGFETVPGVSGISEPSAPEFTLELVDSSYDAPTTYSIDPYTGENLTHFGYRVNKGTIQATIKNNIGASYYTFRYKTTLH